MSLPPHLRRRHLLLGASALLVGARANAQTASTTASPAGVTTWPTIEQAARGRTVYWNAWGGSEQTNTYIQWVAERVQGLHGIRLQHVKVSDTADVVKRVRAEKAAGRGPGQGTVDLVWINGENFAAMKREGLLFGPWAEQLPNFRLVDVQGKPTVRNDFSVPTDGFESPWGMAQFTLFADARRLPQRPQSMAALLELARAQPGRITYPRLPDFHGTTFAKQALVELAPDRSALAKPATEAAFATQTAPLWRFLDALRPHLWRGGRQFPQNAAAVRQMMADGELLLALTFNPNEAANEIAAGRLADTTVSWQFEQGTIGNTHFVAIPYNAPQPAAAQVVANALLAPEAQARKADITHWGDPTVLDLQRLSASERKLFDTGARPGLVERPAPTLPEPHASWVEPIEREWLRRYGS
ncbi:MAG: ABC transporter substrate-binding protein [Hydrogenophaga sp.]|uniref:ABC transporter substrate-binding protein n=1 Tax=Hydrogenophaga sp. TaxID=1904254 RepID=UPI001E187C40|nr:ABC transporter substrate-binding protein [Hydrogenophaga sp.]MBX3610788.1 ABC transporter substrate-binding protein [Hydrogenophaga sp.]